MIRNEALGARRSRARNDVARRQHGIVLPVGLMLLAAMTLVGMATLSDTRLSETMARNAQHKSVAFEAAESAVNALWERDAMMDALLAAPAAPLDDPPAIAPPGVAETLSGLFDQRRDGLLTVDIDVAATVRYCGESALPRGSDLNADACRARMVAMLFDVNGTADITGSAARSEHVRRGSLTRPATDRRGGCTLPGGSV